MVGIDFLKFVPGIVIDIAGDLRLGVGQRSELAGEGVGKGGDSRNAIGLRNLATTSVKGIGGGVVFRVGCGDFVAE